MIGIVKGKVVEKGIEDNYIWADILTKADIAYRLLIPSRIGIEEGSDVEMYTSFQVREDSQSLYGFLDKKDREMFELLLSVSGVGPKTALSMLSTFSVEEINGLVMSEEYSVLSKTPGLGKKGAQKVILELKGKLDNFGVVKNATKKINEDMLKELKSALGSLGFSGSGLNEYLEVASGELEKDPSIQVEDLLKVVLSGK